MKTKDGVLTEKVVVRDGSEVVIRPSVEIRAAMLTANALHKEMTGKEMVITSILDGKHMDGSRHYSGNAFDMRKWLMTKEQIQVFIEALRVSLGPDFDVVEEATHIHVEFDPK